MSTVRVYELAKELNVSNKEVLDFLKSKNIDLTSHMSNVEDDHAQMVRNGLKKAAVSATGAAPQKKQEGEKPKKKFIQVFRPQNASHMPERKPKNRQGGGQEQKNEGKRQDNRQGDNRGTQNSMRQDNRNNRPNNNRNNGGQNGDNRQGGRFNQENRENRRPGSAEGRPRFNNQEGRDNRQGGRQGNNQDRQGGRGDRQGRFGNGENRQGGRFNQENRGEGRRFNNQEGRDNRQGGRFGGNQDRQGGRGGESRRDRDQGVKFDTPNLEFVEKDSRKANRENKKKDNRRDEYQNQNQSKRPNQNGRRQAQRIPKALQLQKPSAHPKEEKKEVVKEITLPEKMTIRELAEKMKMQPAVIVKKLFMEGVMVTVNHEIDFEKAQEIALDYDIIAEPEEKVDVIGELLKEEEDDAETLVSRPPVVCVMGHVDHGKTSLLDCIRKTHVTDREAGGITQHIGAYMVSINGQKITFLDTPGHEAFTAMRMRGANATDIAVLVVAADDGVMPQTVEAINHAKAAGVEIIVAINKIDKPSANVERVKQELSEYELIPEDWGGSTIFVPVSAHTGEGIDNLLEMILLTAEVAELKANPNRRARGLVIEAELDKGKGSVATILVQKGTLHVGDFIAAGACSGKVRAMIDDKGRKVKEAGPSTPVEILGLSDVPNAGEILVVTENDKEAKNFAATFVSENKNRLLEETKAKMSLDDLFSQIQAGNLKELPIIVKADVQGSVEAVKQSLVKLSNEEVVVKVIHGGVGAINESDVTLASASNAIIIGFNVRPDATAKSIAEQEGVDLRLYRVIYQAIEDVEAAMKGMLDPVYEEKVIGHAEIRQIFKASGVGNIAGSYVLDGIFQRNCKVRITREGEQIFEGELASLKRFKDDVKEVKAGYECGLVFEGFNDIKEEDKVEAYIMVEVPR
ncbi:MAG TPA: translation initiation factor IF-2 [Candidatus Blautia pullicola]|uniref:Translation initiation factor IF-2 n=1 Tax=Candidatus Blautia pullicola TaxID=2838498 RepID=A0A9D2FRF2_9FIRM|nr:translation initiation factor IF-2 [Candidatus Blautia pullicola]